MDLISRQAAIDEINNLEQMYVIDDGHDNLLGFAKTRIRVLPSAQPEIIRCKDCKHYIAHDKRCGFWNHGVNIDWYCSQAGRREDDGE